MVWLLFCATLYRTILYPVAAMNMLISGLRILKKQNGAYVNVGTERMVAWVMPQLLHGKRGEVTVAESSTERLRSFPS